MEDNCYNKLRTRWTIFHSIKRLEKKCVSFVGLIERISVFDEEISNPVYVTLLSVFILDHNANVPICILFISRNALFAHSQKVNKPFQSQNFTYLNVFIGNYVILH